MLVVVGDAYSVVANDAEGFGGMALDCKVDGGAGFGIFDGVAEEVCENVAEEAFIRHRFAWDRVQ